MVHLVQIVVRTSPLLIGNAANNSLFVFTEVRRADVWVFGFGKADRIIDSESVNEDMNKSLLISLNGTA